MTDQPPDVTGTIGHEDERVFETVPVHHDRPIESSHPWRTNYDREIAEIKDNVLRMGSLVEAQINGAISSLVAHDAGAATRVIIADGAVNDLQRDVSALIASTIATQSPVARDLRYLLMLDHVGYELERMGDHAGSVAKQARKLAPYPPLKDYLLLPQLGDRVAAMVQGIVRALVEADQDEARRIAELDNEADAMYHRIFAETLEVMRTDPANVDPGSRVLFAAHYLERIGDRVTNIAEDIVFFVSGQLEDLNG